MENGRQGKSCAPPGQRRLRTAVFLGPSLPWEEARAILPAEYYPPARKGDIYRILPSGVETIVLVDGVFHSTPSVWQRELLDALHEGVQVLGAASMGALRAAELTAFGMIGSGTVFAWFRDGVVSGDDEVALAHAPEEFGFQPLSESLVNIRYTLLRAVTDQCLDHREAQRLIDYAKELYYPERSYRGLLQCPALKRWLPHRLAKLENYLLHKSVDIKRRDAIGVLRRAARLQAGRKHRVGRPALRALGETTQQQGQVRQRGETAQEYDRLRLTGFFGARGVVTGEQILAEARKDRTLMSNLWPKLSRRFFLLDWATQNGIRCPKRLVKAALARWKKLRGNGDDQPWLQANGLTRATLHGLLEEQALCDWLTTRGLAYFGLESKAAQAQPPQQRFIVEWAAQNGVTCPAHCLARFTRQWRQAAPRGRHAGPANGKALSPPPSRSLLTERALVEWITKRGPAFFGHDWKFEVALLHELQLTGRAAQIAATLQPTWST